VVPLNRRKAGRRHRGECAAVNPKQSCFSFWETGLHLFRKSTGHGAASRGTTGEGVDENCVESKETWREHRVGPVLHRQNGKMQGQG
jgi:hypothetical protein